MVEYSLCVCYGFVVDHNTLEKIEKYYSQNEEFEAFEEDYVRCVDAWTGDDYFIGLRDAILDCGEKMCYIDDGVNANFTLAEINNFYDLITKFKIKEIIGENPPRLRKMLINFCF